jgi:chitinase
MTILAPYFYIWGYTNSVYKISTLMSMNKTLGATAATLAFIVGDSTNQMSKDIYNMISDIQAFQAINGSIIISFGGAVGPYLEDIYNEDQQFAAIDKLLIDTKCNAIDFDIEGAYIENTKSINQRSKVIARLQQKYPNLYVSFTLPADQNALTQDGINVLKNAISNGVNINIVNMMTMDDPLPSGLNWGDAACQAGDNLVNQLKQFYPNKSSQQLYQMVGITPMIGKNDNGPSFTQQDAITVNNYANKNNIGLVSFWSINRDQVGTGDLGVYSQMNKSDFDFYNNLSVGISKQSLPTQSNVQPANITTTTLSPITPNISTPYISTSYISTPSVNVTTPYIYTPSVNLKYTQNGTIIAPYFGIWAYKNSIYKISSLMDMKNKLNANTATLAFIIADGKGGILKDIYNMKDDITAFQKNGGRIIISFGGASGVPIQDVFEINDIVNIIDTLLTDFNCRAIDYDIEGAAVAMPKNYDKLAKATAILQKKYPDLYVSYTLPAVMPQIHTTWTELGALDINGKNIIKNAISNGVNISIVNMMAMDYSAELPSGKTWGKIAIDICEALKTLLKDYYPNKSNNQLYQMIGSTPMIGLNDQANIIFSQSDASELSAYAKQNNLGLLSFWSMQRDQVGTGDLGVYSQINKSDFEFYKNLSSGISIQNVPTPQPGSTNTITTNTGSTNTGSTNTITTNTGSTNTGSTNTITTNTITTNTINKQSDNIINIFGTNIDLNNSDTQMYIIIIIVFIIILSSSCALIAVS